MPFQAIRGYFSSVRVRKRLLDLLDEFEVLPQDSPMKQFYFLKEISELLKRMKVTLITEDLAEYSLETRYIRLSDLKRSLQKYPNTNPGMLKDERSQQAVTEWLEEIDITPSFINQQLGMLSEYLERILNATEADSDRTAVGRLLKSVNGDLISLFTLLSSFTLVEAKDEQSKAGNKSRA